MICFSNRQMYSSSYSSFKIIAKLGRISYDEGCALTCEYRCFIRLLVDRIVIKASIVFKMLCMVCT